MLSRGNAGTTTEAQGHSRAERGHGPPSGAGHPSHPSSSITLRVYLASLLLKRHFRVLHDLLMFQEPLLAHAAGKSPEVLRSCLAGSLVQTLTSSLEARVHEVCSWSRSCSFTQPKRPSGHWQQNPSATRTVAG